MRLEALLASARQRLSDSPTAALDARLLMQAATGLSIAEMIAEPQREVSSPMAAQFESFIARRAAHEPVSRILGVREFYGRDFLVTPDVLDPRADTECVVTLALQLAKQGRFVDLGTGSGVIAITLCAENAALSGVATDISDSALAVARQNASTHKVAQRLQFHHGRWFEGLDTKFDLIISNPPYIRESEKLPPDVAKYDPAVALYAGADGLEAYREISAAAGAHLAPGGHIVVEVGSDQAIDVKKIFLSRQFSCMAETQDLGNHIRGLAFQLIS